MNDRALQSQIERALEAERRARQPPDAYRFSQDATGGGSIARIFRRNGEIESQGERSGGGRTGRP